MTVDSQTLTYDAIGNPLTYYNGLLWTLTWQNGRELATAKWGTTSVSYTYDAEGVRTSKTVNGVVHNYVYLGGFLVEETWGSNILQFSYDDQNRPYSVDYNGTIYYYVLNQQGDVVQVVDANGVVQGAYVYNAWGEVLEVTAAGTIGTVNPLRYRGYYYDAETGFYYLNSRYYDPEVGRFINADTTDVLSASTTALTDKNLYAYCDNNPVMRKDTGGAFWETAIDVVSLCVSAAEVMANPTDPWAWAGLAGDAIDLIPFVTGVGEMAKVAKVTVKAVDNSDDVIKATRRLYNSSGASSGVRKLNGSYNINFVSGTTYTGKGGLYRSTVSASSKAKKYNDRVTSISWTPSSSVRNAYISEYNSMKRTGVNNANTYNKIWSPGRSIFQSVWSKLFGR